MQADGADSADLTGIDHRPGAHSRGIVHKCFVNAQADAGFPGRGDHLIGLGGGKRHGFLHRDMLAGLAGLDGHRTMQVVGGEQFHQVNILIFQHLLVIGINLFHAPLFGFLLCG